MTNQAPLTAETLAELLRWGEMLPGTWFVESGRLFATYPNGDVLQIAQGDAHYLKFAALLRNHAKALIAAATPRPHGADEVERVARALVRSDINYSTFHFPGDTPREWISPGGATYETTELSPEAAERVRIKACAALAAMPAPAGNHPEIPESSDHPRLAEIRAANEHRLERSGERDFGEVKAIDVRDALWQIDTDRRVLAAQRARIVALENAILWANGEGDEWPGRQPGEGNFYWRKELMRRAALTRKG